MTLHFLGTKSPRGSSGQGQDSILVLLVLVEEITPLSFFDSGKAGASMPWEAQFVGDRTSPLHAKLGSRRRSKAAGSHLQRGPRSITGGSLSLLELARRDHLKQTSDHGTHWRCALPPWPLPRA